MRTSLRWKTVVLICTALVFSTLLGYPLAAARFGWPAPEWLTARGLKLGLDLMGGIHFVLKVETETASRLETERVMADLSRALGTTGPSNARFSVRGPTSFAIEGLEPHDDTRLVEAAVRTLGSEYARERAGTSAYTFTMTPSAQAALRQRTLQLTRQTILRRVNALGVSEPTVAAQGVAGDRLLVQLPGLTDIGRAKAIIQSTGLLELRLVEGGPAGDPAVFQQNDALPPNTDVVTSAGIEGPQSTAAAYYLVRRGAVITGRDLRTARAGRDDYGRPVVTFTLTPDGGRRFAEATSANVGRFLAILLDNGLLSAPRVEERIEHTGQIFGNFTPQEAADLATVLSTGTLPAELTYLEEVAIGATLGADSIRSGVLASCMGLLLVVSFMLAYYKWSGVNAVVALVFNLVLLIGLMAYLGAAMTLPGIAGFILTIGMGVDSNVLIFERIKEELGQQPGVRTAVQAGFRRVFVTLLDTHISALISAAILFQFGTGAVRGFAVTLAIGLIANLFTSTFVSKTLFELALARAPRARLSI